MNLAGRPETPIPVAYRLLFQAAYTSIFCFIIGEGLSAIEWQNECLMDFKKKLLKMPHPVMDK